MLFVFSVWSCCVRRDNRRGRMIAVAIVMGTIQFEWNLQWTTEPSIAYLARRWHNWWLILHRLATSVLLTYCPLLPDRWLYTETGYIMIKYLSFIWESVLLVRYLCWPYSRASKQYKVDCHENHVYTDRPAECSRYDSAADRFDCPAAYDRGRPQS